MKKLVFAILLCFGLGGCAGHNPPPEGTRFSEEQLDITDGTMHLPLTVTQLTYKGEYYYSFDPADPFSWMTQEGGLVAEVVGFEFADELSFAYRFVREFGKDVSEPNCPDPTPQDDLVLPEKF